MSLWNQCSKVRGQELQEQPWDSFSLTSGSKELHVFLKVFIRQKCYLCPSSHPDTPLCWIPLALYSFLISSLMLLQGIHLPALIKVRSLKETGEILVWKVLGMSPWGNRHGRELKISVSLIRGKGLFYQLLIEATLSLVKRCGPNSYSTPGMSPCP